MEERFRLIEAWKREECSIAALCREFGVTRKTGYKWLRRYESGGVDGLRDQSRAPHRQAHAIRAEIEQRVLEARYRWPRWGPRKLRWKLLAADPQVHWPSVSCMGALLKRHGLVAGRRRVPRHRQAHTGLTPAAGANRVWAADFKGWFLTGDGRRCEPLTITDLYSRLLLRCQIVPHTDTQHARAIFDAAFREYGLPEVLRTDNGSPFASVGRCGLTRLTVHWIKLGIRPERIAPGRPQQNGCHERMHRTLKLETAQPPAGNARAQQRRFDEFRRRYNHERPHEALGGATPITRYRPSAREFSDRPRSPEYEEGFQVRRVFPSGEIKCCSKVMFLSEALAGERVGLKQIGDQHWRVYFSFYELGVWDHGNHRFLTPAEWQKKMRLGRVPRG